MSRPGNVLPDGYVPPAGSPLDDEPHVATTGWFVLTDGYDPANESHLVDDSVSMLGAVADHARDSGLAVETEGRIARAK